MRTQLAWYQTFLHTDPSAVPPVLQRPPRQAAYAPQPPSTGPSDRAPPFPMPQPPSSPAASLPEPSDAPHVAYAPAPQAVYHEHGHPVHIQPQIFAHEGSILGRIMAAFLAIGEHSPCKCERVWNMHRRPAMHGLCPWGCCMLRRACQQPLG